MYGHSGLQDFLVSLLCGREKQTLTSDAIVTKQKTSINRGMPLCHGMLL